MCFLDLPIVPILLGESSGMKASPMKTHYLRRLVAHVKEGGVLDGRKDVPETVCEELYMEEQQRQEKNNLK